MAEAEAPNPDPELIRLAFEEGGVAMAITTLDGKMVEVNRAFVEALGFERDELLGTSMLDLWWVAGSRPNLVERLLSERKIDGIAVSLRSKSGERVELTCNWRLLTFNGAPHIMGVGVDRTKELAATAVARELEQRFLEIANSLKEVFWVASLDVQRLLYVSPAYQAIWGRSCASLLENPAQWLEAIHPEDQARVRAANAQQLTRPYDVQYRVIRPDGSVRWVHDRSFVVRSTDGEPTAIGGVAEDVTERRELEQKFHQAQKLESIGRLAGGVAHDFNNLLTVISATTSVLLEDLGESSPDHQEIAREVRHALERGSALTRQLLAFSRQQVIEPKVLDLNKVIADAEKMLRRLIGEDVELITRLAPGLPSVKADPGQLTQVLLNLCVNARDAMPTGGKLLVETRIQEVGEEHARAHLGARPGRYLRLSVTDTGEGMSPEVQARIFEPFFTTKPAGKGTGLGLAVVFGVVQQSGGHVEVVSAPRAGATFHVYLPIAAERAEPEHTEAPARAGGSETVLLVEDDEAVRRVATRVLRAAGFEVLEAGDGEQALELLRHDRRPVELLVTDVVMPGLNGRVLSERARLERPGLKVLFVSGYTDDAVVRHGVLREEVAFLNKPFEPAALVRKVRQVLDAQPEGPEGNVIPIARAVQRQL